MALVACDDVRAAGVGPCNREARGRAATGLTGLAPAFGCWLCAVGEFSLRLARRVLDEVVVRLTFIDVFERGKPTSAEGEVEACLGGAILLRRVATSGMLFSSSNSKSSKRPFLGLSMHGAMLTSGESLSKDSSWAAWLARALRGEELPGWDEEADSRCSESLKLEDSSEKSVASEILAIERVWRIGCSSMLVRNAVARRFCGDVVDMVMMEALPQLGRIAVLDGGIRYGGEDPEKGEMTVSTACTR